MTPDQRAEQTHADLIVVGRRGFSKFEDLVVGAVSERVLTWGSMPGFGDKVVGADKFR